MVKKLVEMGILFDFYGKLLSQRQHSVVELYYIHDLSLAEIGEELSITRQGVFDNLKRGEQNLYKYEAKLKLVEKFHSNYDKIKEIIDCAEKINKNLNSLENNNISKDIKNKVLFIKKISKEILDDNQGV